MKRLIEYPLKDGGSIVIEVDEPEEEGVVRVKRPGEVVEKANQEFETVMERVKPMAAVIINKLSDLSESPNKINEIAVEFGIKLSAAAGVVVASAGVEANYRLTLKWMRK